MKIQLILLSLALVFYSGCRSLKIQDIPEDLTAIDNPYLTSQVTYQRNALGVEELEPPLSQIWEESYMSLPNRGFTIVNNWLLFGTSNGYMVAANLNNGKIKGKENLGDSCPVPPTVYSNILYQTFEAGKYGLIAYDASTGDVIWRVENSSSRSSPIVVDKKVYYHSFDGDVLCFNFLTGELIWSEVINSHIRNSAAFTDNLIITAALDGIVIAHEYTSGVTVWQKNLGAAIMADPVIDGNRLYIASHNGILYQLDVYTGKILYQSDFKNPIYYGPTIDEKNIYLPLSNGKIITLDKKSFKKRWDFQGVGPLADSPLVTGSYIYFTTLAKHLYVIEKLAGQSLQDIEIEGRARSTPVIKDKKLIISCENNRVIAFAEKN